MRLGIFAKIFLRPTVEQTFDAVRRCGIGIVQFNFSCAGLPTIPDSIEQPVLDRIRQALEACQIEVAAVSATFNLIDPDRERRNQNLKRLDVLANACEGIGASTLTLCTGTRDPDDMWRAHPDNRTADAWTDLLYSLEAALWMTEPSAPKLLVEPEPGNVVSDAVRARRLLDEMKSPRLGILFDAANIFAESMNRPQRDVLSKALDLLAPEIALAHGKELSAEHDQRPRAPGQGILDWGVYLELLAQAGYQGPLILHGFEEQDAEEAVWFAKSLVDR